MPSLTNLTGQLFTDPYTRPLSADGKTMPGCYRVFYKSNSTTLGPGSPTSLYVYQDAGLSTPYNQPVYADSNGRFGPIYLDPQFEYRSQLFNAAGQLLEDVDPINNSSIGTPTIVGSSRSAFKATTTLRSNTAALPDPDLYVTVTAAGTYKVDLDVVFTATVAGATPGFSMELFCAATLADQTYNLVGMGQQNGVGAYSNSVASVIMPINSLITGSLGTTAVSNTMRYSGTLQILTSGFFQLYWGQKTSSANSISLLAGSSLTVAQVA